MSFNRLYYQETEEWAGLPVAPSIRINNYSYLGLELTTMQQIDTYETMDSYQFPRQKVLCDETPFSNGLLRSLLEMVYVVSPPFTGYLKLAGDNSALCFLFFFNGAPYAAGRYIDGKPTNYTIQELGRYLVSSADKGMSVALCETDPVMLKSMLLFLQEEPDVKAPVSLIDIECIVQQIGKAGTNAMITLCCDRKINFFFFREGKGALAHYSDQAFERPKGMTIDEEMLLYAYQPGDNVQAFIFRNMVTTMAEDSAQLDKDSLYKLLTVGYLEDRRRRKAERSPTSAGNPKDTRGREIEIFPIPAVGGGKPLVDVLSQKPNFPSIELFVESGPLQGERFTVTLPCIIGRRGCDLVLDDHRISRRHAELKIVENMLIIEDLVSTNGTKVNGEAVTKKRLIPNDLISIGPTKLRISRV